MLISVSAKYYIISPLTIPLLVHIIQDIQRYVIKNPLKTIGTHCIYTFYDTSILRDLLTMTLIYGHYIRAAKT